MEKELRTVKYKKLHPRLNWQNWTKSNLPKSLIISDVDNFIRSRKGEVLFLEIKSHGAKWTQAQSISMQFLNHMAKKANGDFLPIKIGEMKTKMQIKYMGMILVSFQGAEGDFSKKVKANGLYVSERELIDILSFKMTFSQLLAKRKKEKAYP